MEQSLEWNSPLYINFIDYEKAFNSVDRKTMWKLLRHYGVPEKIISLIRCTYQNMSCRIAHTNQLSESFEVKTGVQKRCLLSPFLFLLVIDWMSGAWRSLQQWYTVDTLDALWRPRLRWWPGAPVTQSQPGAGQDHSPGDHISRDKAQDQQKEDWADEDEHICQHINHSWWRAIREMSLFSIGEAWVDQQGGTDRDIIARISKTRAAFVMLKNIWASGGISIRTKLRIFNSSVKSILLNGCETWQTTQMMQQKIQTFFNTCLRCIF